MPKIPDLPSAVWALVHQIPVGRVATYGGMARSLGDVVASRFVGQTLLHHEHDQACPCHRAVRADGSVGKYCLGESEKASRLRRERIVVEGGRVDLGRYEFDEFTSDHPLRRLADYQDKLAIRIRHAAPRRTVLPRLVGGVDLSYIPGLNQAVAALVEVDLDDRALIYTKLVCRPVRFPYISSYLAFRELPILLELLAEVRRERKLPPVILVDGSGILHPRRAGIAAMLGAVGDAITIGVTKKHLAGHVDIKGLQPGAVREVTLSDSVCGFALLPGSGTRQPIYVSPGLGVDVAAALAIVQRTLLGRRLPEPIYWADRLSREGARNASLATRD